MRLPRLAVVVLGLATTVFGWGFGHGSQARIGEGQPQAQIPTCSPSSNAISRRIAYYDVSNVRSRNCDKVYPNQIDMTNFTHLVLSHAVIDSQTFVVIPEHSSDEIIYEQFRALPDAIEKWIQVSFAQDTATAKDVWLSIATSDKNRKSFAENVLRFLDKWQFKGVHIDWDWCHSMAGERDLIVRPSDILTTVKHLRSTIGNSHGLSVSLPTREKTFVSMDPGAIQPYVDWFNFISYDLHGAWEASRIKLHTDLEEVDKGLRLAAAARIDPGKINMAITNYGRGYTARNTTCVRPGCEYIRPSKARKCSKQEGFLSACEIQQIISKHQLQPKYVPGQAKQIVSTDQWTAYDDVDTMHNKLAYAKAHCLGGYALWSINRNTCAKARGRLRARRDAALVHAVSQSIQIISQVSDGQLQAPPGPTQIISQISDGQIHAPPAPSTTLGILSGSSESAAVLVPATFTASKPASWISKSGVLVIGIPSSGSTIRLSQISISFVGTMKPSKSAVSQHPATSFYSPTVIGTLMTSVLVAQPVSSGRGTPSLRSIPSSVQGLPAFGTQIVSQQPPTSYLSLTVIKSVTTLVLVAPPASSEQDTPFFGPTETSQPTTTAMTGSMVTAQPTAVSGETHTQSFVSTGTTAVMQSLVTAPPIVMSSEAPLSWTLTSAGSISWWVPDHVISPIHTYYKPIISNGVTSSQVWFDFRGSETPTSTAWITTIINGLPTVTPEFFWPFPINISHSDESSTLSGSWPITRPLPMSTLTSGGRPWYLWPSGAETPTATSWETATEDNVATLVPWFFFIGVAPLRLPHPRFPTPPDPVPIQPPPPPPKPTGDPECIPNDCVKDCLPWWGLSLLAVKRPWCPCKPVTCKESEEEQDAKKKKCSLLGCGCGFMGLTFGPGCDDNFIEIFPRISPCGLFGCNPCKFWGCKPGGPGPECGIWGCHGKCFGLPGGCPACPKEICISSTQCLVKDGCGPRPGPGPRPKPDHPSDPESDDPNNTDDDPDDPSHPVSDPPGPPPNLPPRPTPPYAQPTPKPTGNPTECEEQDKTRVTDQFVWCTQGFAVSLLPSSQETRWSSTLVTSLCVTIVDATMTVCPRLGVDNKETTTQTVTSTMSGNSTSHAPACTRAPLSLDDDEGSNDPPENWLSEFLTYASNSTAVQTKTSSSRSNSLASMSASSSNSSMVSSSASRASSSGVLLTLSSASSKLSSSGSRASSLGASSTSSKVSSSGNSRSLTTAPQTSSAPKPKPKPMDPHGIWTIWIYQEASQRVQSFVWNLTDPNGFEAGFGVSASSGDGTMKTTIESKDRRPQDAMPYSVSVTVVDKQAWSYTRTIFTINKPVDNCMIGEGKDAKPCMVKYSTGSYDNDDYQFVDSCLERCGPSGNPPVTAMDFSCSEMKETPWMNFKAHVYGTSSAPSYVSDELWTRRYSCTFKGF